MDQIAEALRELKVQYDRKEGIQNESIEVFDNRLSDIVSDYTKQCTANDEWRTKLQAQVKEHMNVQKELQSTQEKATQEAIRNSEEIQKIAQIKESYTKRHHVQTQLTKHMEQLEKRIEQTEAIQKDAENKREQVDDLRRLVRSKCKAYDKSICKVDQTVYSLYDSVIEKILVLDTTSKEIKREMKNDYEKVIAFIQHNLTINRLE